MDFLLKDSRTGQGSAGQEVSWGSSVVDELMPDKKREKGKLGITAKCKGQATT